MQVGYGDVTPVNALEEMLCIALMLIGVIFFGFVISSSQCAHMHACMHPPAAARKILCIIGGSPCSQVCTN